MIRSNSDPKPSNELKHVMWSSYIIEKAASWSNVFFLLSLGVIVSETSKDIMMIEVS